MTVTRAQFATALLKKMNAPRFHRNKVALVTWAQTEGTTARFNPYGCTLRLPGSTNFPGNTAGVQEYQSLGQGVEATLKTLRYPNHGYEKIRHRLQLTAPARYTCEAIGNSDWGTSLSLLLDVLPSVQDRYPLYSAASIGD